MGYKISPFTGKFDNVGSTITGSGAVDSVNGYTGIVVLTKTDIGLSNADNTSDLNKPVSTAVQAELDLKQNNLTAFNNAIFYQVAPNDIQGIPDWEVNALGCLTQTKQQVTSNITGQSINNWITNIKQPVNSPDQNYTIHYNRANLDVDDEGFSFGTNGRAISFTSNDFSHDKESDIGEVAFTSNYFSIGQNGLSAINANGFSYSYGFGDVRDNVTILSAMQGYGFQPNFANGSIVADTSYLSAFYDATNAPNTIFSFYTGMALSPTLGGILNNRNMASININPNVTEFFGNAGYQGIGLFETLGTFGVTGYYNGITISPNITDIPNATMIGIYPVIANATNSTGLDIDMTNVTGTNISAARFTGAVSVFGDLNVSGSLNFTGNLTTGKIDAFATQNFVDGGGGPATVHGLVSGVLAPNGVTTANADTIGVNTAMLMTFEEDSVTTSGPFGIGACASALPAIITMETTATTQHVRGGVFALNLEGTSTGGTIANAVGCRAVLIPNGITTVSKYIAYEADLPFGAPNADDSWGFHCSADIYNHMAGSLVVGSSQEKTTNTSIGLEIASTTKAFMNARMTTTERDALTAVNGMQVYNSTTDKLQVYAAGSWVDLH